MIGAELVSVRKIRVADEVWIATALLHREHRGREDFSVAEIVRRARRENLTNSATLRPGVRAHAGQHCVAGKPASPGRYRMLIETSRGRRRLYASADRTHRDRVSGKALPRRDEIPEEYHYLLDWYRNCFDTNPPPGADDPILSLRGLGKELWADENADDYVRRLRERWE